MNKKLSKLESLRGFATVYVVFHHSFENNFFLFGHNISYIFRFGQEAVILFFFLSGFVIHYSYSNSKNKSFKWFFFKRFFRIYIPLIIVFTVNFLIFYLQNSHLPKFAWVNLLGNFFMIQDDSWIKPNVICTPFLGNTPLWSLSYEWWFYMIFIFISLKVKVNQSYLVYSLSIISTLTYLIYPNFINRELMYLIIWWIGTDIAKLYINQEMLTLNALSSAIYVLLLNILLLIVNALMHRNQIKNPGLNPILELRHFCFAFLCIIAVIFWQRINWIGFKHTFGLFEKVAPISFGIYISHWFLITTATYLYFLTINKFVLFFLYSVICILFSILVEKIMYPALNNFLLKYLTNKQVNRYEKLR